MQLSVKQIREVYKNAQSVIEAEQRQQFILTQGAQKCFMEQVATGFSNYSAEEIIFFSIYIPAAIVSKTPSGGNIRVLRLLSISTKSFTPPSFKTFLFWPINSKFTTYRSEPKAFQSVIDKYQEASHFITENFKTSK